MTMIKSNLSARLIAQVRLLEFDEKNNSQSPANTIKTAIDSTGLNLTTDDVIKNLDRSSTLDEIDSVAFGLETDDGKIVKVYVKVEESDEFEKALGVMLGKIDNIEDALNELAKTFEIIDVDWPIDSNTPTDEQPEESNGEEVLDPRVYGNKKKDTIKKADTEMELEDLNIGENLSLRLLENSSTIESRFTTPTQLMIYHAILELGIPAIALTRNSYRGLIVKGIKQAAASLIPSEKSALKLFIQRNIDFEKQAEENKSVIDKKDDTKIPKDESPKKDVTEERIFEDNQEWEFELNDDVLSIQCNLIKFDLNDEEIEKLIKSIANHSIVVLNDNDDKTKKIVFSPRGTTVSIKLVGSQATAIMKSTDVDKLLSTITPPKDPQKEEE